MDDENIEEMAQFVGKDVNMEEEFDALDGMEKGKVTETIFFKNFCLLPIFSDQV